MAHVNPIHFNYRYVIDPEYLSKWQDEISQIGLQARLRTALKNEDYEKCALLRDKLEEIKIVQIKAKYQNIARLDKYKYYKSKIWQHKS